MKKTVRKSHHPLRIVLDKELTEYGDMKKIHKEINAQTISICGKLMRKLEERGCARFCQFPFD